MIYKNLVLHGINDIEEINSKKILHRLPKNVRENLESPGTVSKSHSSSEIRFYIEGVVKIKLSSVDSKSSILVYFGDHQHEYHFLKENEEIELILEPFYQEDDRLEKVNKYTKRYHPNVVRIVLYETISLDNIEGSYRMPKSDEVPSKKYLAYGTSITQGRKGLIPELNYPSIFGERIGHDVYNYGMSGCCFIEDAMVDFLASESYDFISLCLSVNMLGKGYELDVFKKRATNLITKLRNKNPNAPIFAITIFRSWREVGLKKDVVEKSTVFEYRKALIEIASMFDNVYIINGENTSSIERLASDILHPGNLGLIEIAYNLYGKYLELGLNNK